VKFWKTSRPGSVLTDSDSRCEFESIKRAILETCIQARPSGSKRDVRMIIEEQIPLLEEILTEWRAVIGNEYEGYKKGVRERQNGF